MNDVNGWLVFLAIVILTFILVWALLRNRPYGTHEEITEHTDHEESQKSDASFVTSKHESLSNVSEVPDPDVVEVAEKGQDNLEIIEGIGPKIAEILKSAGITTFGQLSEMDSVKIKEILVASNLRVNDPTTWPEQARLADIGDMQALNKYQEQLRGGRVKIQ